jgi:hypothetical protein
MRGAARKANRPPPPGPTLEQRVEQLFALYSELLVRSFVQAARLNESEAFNAKVSTKLGLDPPPKPTISEMWRTAKQICGATGYSSSHIYSLAKRGKIVWQKVDGRILIDITSVPRCGK